MAAKQGASPWAGMNLSGWLSALRSARYQVDWRYLPKAAAITFFASHSSVLRRVAARRYGAELERMKLEQDPLFVIGHWRCGTTHLHTLLGLDERFTYPTVYECTSPNAFLLDTPRLKRTVSRRIPTKRPFDNMAWGADSHGEDEFALCNLGVPSPYINMAFPNGRLLHKDYLDLERISTRERDEWKRALETFVKQITLQRPKRVVLKSPTHTFRIKTLLEIFPRAAFAHIVRNPYEVFPSTMHLWRTCCLNYGLQEPQFDGLKEVVFSAFDLLYETLDQTRELVQPGRFHELRYEDLVSDPVETMRTLYDELSLGDFEEALPAIRQHLESVKDYGTNRYDLPADLRDEITERWGEVIERYGYEPPSG